MQHWIRIIVWAVVAGCALGVGAQVWVFVTGDMDVFDSKYGAGFPVLLAHGGFGVWALCLGPFQYMAAGWPRIHRVLGPIYLLCALISAGAALLLAPIADGGPWGRAGAAVQAGLWLGTGVLGGIAVRRGQDHGAWMIRNYALAFGAVTMPAMSEAFAAAGIPGGHSLPWLAWVSWIPNLIVAELLIRRGPPAAEGRYAAHVGPA